MLCDCIRACRLQHFSPRPKLHTFYIDHQRTRKHGMFAQRACVERGMSKRVRVSMTED